jgi:hypothetical protein
MNMRGKTKYFSTNYFTLPSTWYRRVFIILILLGGSVALPMAVYVVFSFFVLCFILVYPVDDLAFNEKYIFHIRRSVVPFFSKVTRFEIEKIQDFKITIIHMDVYPWQFLEPTHVTILFMDRSFKLLMVYIKKEKVIALAEEVLASRRSRTRQS